MKHLNGAIFNEEGEVVYIFTVHNSYDIDMAMLRMDQGLYTIRVEGDEDLVIDYDFA